jgi:predicted acylesterase/phospholipase RssA
MKVNGRRIGKILHIMPVRRDTAIVLSGGGMNAVLMELGFLLRLRISPLWQRVGWIFGTSAGALAGSLATRDRLGELERFLLDLRVEDTFRPRRLWQLPLLGLHDYTLPDTVAARFGEPAELGRDLAASPIELVVLTTDLTDSNDGSDGFEVAYSSRTTPPEEFARAVFASAAISALVLPLHVGERILTDGSWVRNYPLGYAFARPEVRRIVAFRYVPGLRHLDPAALVALRRRLERFGRLPALRTLVAELRAAEGRAERGEPAHLAENIVRLARVSIVRNTELEERWMEDKDASIRELAALRDDVVRLAGEHGPEVARRFAEARFPFGGDRDIPRIVVRGSREGISLEPGWRTQRPWTETDKRRLIVRGYELTDDQLANESSSEPSGSSS